MTPTRLQDDLIKDFLEQKRTINEQIKLIDPMATSLRRPVAQRLLHSSFSIFLEVICWLLFAGLLAYVVFMDRLVPFYVLSKLIQTGKGQPGFTDNELVALNWSIKGLVVLIALLVLVISRMLAKIRQKNAILHIAGKNMKQLVEENLKRKSAIEAIEQRHIMELPATTDSIVTPPAKPHNDILLD